MIKKYFEKYRLEILMGSLYVLTLIGVIRSLAS